MSGDPYTWSDLAGELAPEYERLVAALAGDPFGVAEPTVEELRQEAVDRADDAQAERYES